MNIPRIMFAAPKSSSGKTLITCAMLGACKERQLHIVSCKCGPDYIDPMFHRTVLGIPSENLDTYFTDEEQTRSLLCEFVSEQEHSPELVVMEGVMGLYDGLGGIRKEGSSYHLASVTKTPIILVVDVHGMGQTMIPVISGILQYDKEHLIRGIILNRISRHFYESMKPLLEEELSVPVLGYMESHPELVIDSRHLGLKLPVEMDNIHKMLSKASAYLCETVDVDGILAIARNADDLCVEEVNNADHSIVGETEKLRLEREKKDFLLIAGEKEDRSIDKGSDGSLIGKQPSSSSLMLAVARDEAFCFYYEENLRLLEKAGIHITYFSPLQDERLPEESDGILLGGGYPELYAEALSRNISMRESIRTAIRNGMPSLAECGGFMYLHKELQDDKGRIYPMVGVINGRTYYVGKSVRFGYVEIREDGEQAHFLMKDRPMKGHEFHYYDSTLCGEDAYAVKPVGSRKWHCCHIGESHWWGFPHLYYPSCPEFVGALADSLKRYHIGKDDNQALIKNDLR